MVLFKILLILIALINVVLSVNLSKFSTVGKCCPPGRVFFNRENFTCAALDDENSLELHDTRSNHWGNEDFRGCPSANLSVTSLSDIDSIIPGSTACIDLLYCELKYTPFIFFCQDDKENLPVPRLTAIRKCCPSGQFYDINSRNCVNDLTPSNIIKNIDDLLHDTVDFVTISYGPPICDYAIVDHVVNIQDVKFLQNGTFQVLISSGNGLENLVLDTNDACLDSGPSTDTLIIRSCSTSNFCDENTCIRKCCAEDEAWIEHKCQKVSLYKEPTGKFHQELKKVIASLSPENSTRINVLNSTNYGLIIGLHECEDGMYPILPNESWHVTPQGHVYVPGYKAYEHHEYCMDMLYGNHYYRDGLYPCVCFNSQPVHEAIEPERFGINAALELTSCMFLLLTFLVYLCLPLLQNLHGKTLMCHVASLFVAYACLATIALTPPPDAYNEDKQPRTLCKFLGYTTLLAFLASFSWLNIMCFDIWWTFGGYGGAAHIGGKKNAQKKRFIIYSLYAWGFSLFITSLAITADHTDTVKQHLRPNIAVDSCWFAQTWNNQGEMVYFIGPVSIQLATNVVFFILTLRHCSRVKADISKVMISTTEYKKRRFQADRSKLILNIKLFIVMGISWIFEIISYFMNHYAVDLRWRTQFFYISDSFNCLQGLLIFILFVLKIKVYYALMHRLGRRKANRPTSVAGTSLQDPFKVKKSISCSTLTSTFAISNSP
ncbi:probable G-protein coupled receptor Mth-like 11 [Chelonus insularis]|uniref:probable G-protein coupled receptor Mth-like 11 n=1 Tax=Chelonus insularis TaxID=460826 RepID=UPI00158E7217|nr:probable G-protein coupled receptor Mth-like 11 [Chelonus insularis]